MNATLQADDTRSDERAIADMLGAFRRRHIEPAWDQLNVIDAARYAALWHGLGETGLTACALPEESGGVPLDPAALFTACAVLGAACPALAAALVAHLTAQALIVEAADGKWPAVAALAADASYTLLASPLDCASETGFEISFARGRARLSGRQRVMLPAADWLAIPARGPDRLHLCLLRADTPGFSFRLTPSSHGLCLLPFGELAAQEISFPDAQVFAWPGSGAAANLADGLLAALLAGMNDELAVRAMDYARQRYQGGKMIGEHHAVQQLIGPIELARRPLRALAIATLARRGVAGNGGASAFSVPLVRRSALDAVQTFGGYGYMQDYRVERYLRDANTLETFWIHAAQRERDAATQLAAALARGEAA